MEIIVNVIYSKIKKIFFVYLIELSEKKCMYEKVVFL